MTTFDFQSFNTSKITKIGTAGGWVKPSTGYSFKLTEKRVAKIVENIKTNQPTSNGLFKNKYKFYDKVFLQVLKDNNEKGEWIFKQFYSKNSTPTMFKFLDEESSLFEDIKIMWSLFSFRFIKAFFNLFEKLLLSPIIFNFIPFLFNLLVFFFKKFCSRLNKKLISF